MNQSLAALRLGSAKQAAASLAAGSSTGKGAAHRARGYAADAKAKNPYSHTLRLPRTGFPLRADAARREKEFRKRCTDTLYEWQLENNRGEKFILHDGPPYANGDLHIGHFMNKVLKDIINRYQVMQGRRVVYIPGFDGHGLPIEQKALERLKAQDRDSLDPMAIRKLARDFALEAVKRQTKSFKEYGVMGDWSHPYLTLDPGYEADQLGIFKVMVERGYIYRQNKPVYWSPSSHTALAEAELEYNDKHVSTSVYVKMPLTSESAAKLGATTGDVSALIWTTTPWTLPANRAIAVRHDLEYVLARVVEGGGSSAAGYQLLVGKDRLAAIAELLPEGSSIAELGTFAGKQLEGLEYTSPISGKQCRVLLADYVTGDSGTGLVHSAPGHGQEDYEFGLANGIEIFSPVDDYGRFTNEAGPTLAGKEVLGEGSRAVVDMLTAQGLLLSQQKFTHSYPYDWRTKLPIIQRATPQWFANVGDLKASACESLREVAIVPESSRRRLESYVTGRSEWCISRQRVWGVPIPVFYNAASGEPLLTAESIDHVISVIRDRGGSDAWWMLPTEELLAPAYRSDGNTYIKGNDTMDVWFDSGSSWRVLDSVAKDRAGAYADMYLEGSDQHRGWFQSSLLTSNAVRGVAPYRTLLTHGFTLDEQRRKMSKSMGNTLVPDRVINGGRDKKKEPAYGVDLLRLVVGSTDYTHDVSFGPGIFAQFSDVIRKIRGTVRFMLGNLDGFTADKLVPYEQMSSIDRYMLHELYHFKQAARTAFEKYEFFRAMQAVNNFTNSELSAFYFDISKDCLYVNGEWDLQRRSTLTALFRILVDYTTTLAPVTCHLAEEVWSFAEVSRRALGKTTGSVFQEPWDQTLAEWDNPELAAEWAALRRVRAVANQAIEAARTAKLIGSSLEAELDVFVPLESRLGRLLTKHAGELRRVCITSQASVHEIGGTATMAGEFAFEDRVAAFGEDAPVRVVSRRSLLHKCPRCWNLHFTQVDALCGRCDDVVAQEHGCQELK
ncbi:isoleucine-tRNA ligase [Coemansia sp. Cherry 401B]|nr:isoleucine-tRNA ligase [Coemansia sp. Cherry 401B]